MRRGEILGLRWTDIDFATNTLTIRRTVQRIVGEGLVEMPTKTKSSDWRIPLSPPCIKVLKEHERFQQAQRDRAGKAWVKTGHVFTSSIGTPLDPQHVSMNIGRLCEQAGIRRIRFHDLRHSCATLLIESGAPLITVKELLGHSNIMITANTYTHTRLPHQADALRLLDDQLDRPESKSHRRSSTDAEGKAETRDEAQAPTSSSDHDS
jgi:integrase